MKLQIEKQIDNVVLVESFNAKRPRIAKPFLKSFSECWKIFKVCLRIFATLLIKVLN